MTVHKVFWSARDLGGIEHAYVHGAGTGDVSVCGLARYELGYRSGCYCRACFTATQGTPTSYIHSEWDDKFNDNQPTNNHKENKKMATAKQAEQAHKRDLELIGERMKELAEEHNWCTTFREAVKELNEELTFPIPMATTVSGKVEFSITLSFDEAGVDGITESDQVRRKVLILKDRLIDFVNDQVVELFSDEDEGSDQVDAFVTVITNTLAIG